MGSRFRAIFSIWAEYRLFTVIAIIFGLLSFFFGLFIVEPTNLNAYILYFSNFFTSFEGLICVTPFLFGFGCLIIYLFVEILKNDIKRDYLSEIPSNKLLTIAFMLITISIISLYLAFPASNPHELLFRLGIQYSVNTHGSPFWWPYHFHGAMTYLREIVNFKVDIGLILGLFVSIFMACEIISNKLLISYHYNKYLPNLNN